MRTDYKLNRIFDNQAADIETPVAPDALEALVRRAAQVMLQEALEVEVSEFLARSRSERGRNTGADFRGYRNGYHREREITTASGAIRVRQPRVSETPREHGKFESQLIKPYKRRTKALDELFPKLFVEGLATRDFEPALRSLLGESAPLSPSTVSRLNRQFKDEYESWQRRSLAELSIVYLWADGVYLQAGIADERLCLLVVMGVDTSGQKHFLGLEEGYRESKESWLSLLRSLKERGMNAPALVTADGGLGFWAALPEVWGQTRKQLCWLHKTRNILDKLPQKEREAAAQRLRGIYLASDFEAARVLAERLIKEWRGNYPKAAECLAEALPRLLTFFDFPSEHWKHIRTTNPIESVFATVRLRTNAAKRFRSSRSGVHLVFKLLQRCEQGWLRITAAEKLKEVKLPERGN